MSDVTQTQSNETLPDELARRNVCYLTTTGRITGNSHEIEIWFAARGDTIYILSGGRDRSDWVKNIAKTPDVRIRFDNQVYTGTGRIVGTEEPDDRIAREALVTKYYGWREGQPINNWGRESLPVAISLDGNA